MRPSRVEAQRLRGCIQLCGGRGGRPVCKRSNEFRRSGQRLAGSGPEEHLVCPRNFECSDHRLARWNQRGRAARGAQAAALIFMRFAVCVVVVLRSAVVRTDGYRVRMDRARVQAWDFCEEQREPANAECCGNTAKRSDGHASPRKYIGNPAHARTFFASLPIFSNLTPEGIQCERRSQWPLFSWLEVPCH